MDLDQLKASWQAYDQRLTDHQPLSEYTLRRLIRQDSGGTLERMARKLQLIALLATALLLLGVATLLGNPFDYSHWLAYTPIALYVVLAGLSLALSSRTYYQIRQIDLTATNLRQSLLALLTAQQRMDRVMNHIWSLGMLAGLVTCGWLILRQMAVYGPYITGLMLLGLLVSSGLVYRIATRYFGALSNPYAAQLQQHLRELDSLEGA